MATIRTLVLTVEGATALGIREFPSGLRLRLVEMITSSF